MNQSRSVRGRCGVVWCGVCRFVGPWVVPVRAFVSVRVVGVASAVLYQYTYPCRGGWMYIHTYYIGVHIID